MKKLFISLLFIPFIVWGNKSEIINKNFNLSYDWLVSQPKSYAKDFFIIQYLNKEDTTNEQAIELFKQARNKKGRVKKAYNKKFSNLPADELRCYSLKTYNLLKENDRCLALGLSIYEATLLSKQQLQQSIRRLSSYPTLKNDLILISSKKFNKEVIKTNIYRYYRLFFKSKKIFRKNKFNIKMPQHYIDSLSKHKDFNKYVRFIVTNDKLNKLQQSLFHVKINKNLSTQTLFFLGINALKNYKTSIALKYIDVSYKKAYYKIDKDRALFWKVLIKKEIKYLEKLANSWDNNIYSLFAKELLKIPIDNVVYNIEQEENLSSFNHTNQFEWINVLDDTKKMDKTKLEKYKSMFSSKETLPHYAYILARYNRYKKQYFIRPYKDTIDKFPMDQQILIYSIAKQESNFIQSSISTATALGVMQIMPFLSKDIAKKLDEPYNIYEQFSAKKNIEYANYHLNTLKKSFKHPLFIAYAYNGGAGYTRSQFKNGLFQKRRKFEPFLSMELISYNETRKYAKKVLANYYIYHNSMKEDKVTLKTIFRNLLP